MGDFPSLHSCLYMQAENERIIAKYKRLKEKYRNLSRDNATISKSEVVKLPAKCVERGTQTTVRKEDQVGEDKQTTRLLQNHAVLVRKYEKELANNTENSETISNLKILNSKLEAEIKTNREKLNKATTSLEKFKLKTERLLSNTREDVFKITAERDTLKFEHEKLKAEMKGIDKDFFDEIEDLKYALQESAKMNKIYEKALQSVCKKSKIDFQEVLLHTVQKISKKNCS